MLYVLSFRLDLRRGRFLWLRVDPGCWAFMRDRERYLSKLNVAPPSWHRRDKRAESHQENFLDDRSRTRDHNGPARDYGNRYYDPESDDSPFDCVANCLCALKQNS